MSFFKKHLFLILVICGLFSALVFYSLNIPRNREANFIERGILNIFSPILKQAQIASVSLERFRDDYLALVSVRQENKRLIEDIKILRRKIVTEAETELANKRLAKLLGLRDSVKEKTIVANVVGEDVSSWFKTLVIDCGSSSGLKDGMAVMAADGVVGQVVKVSANSARVLILNDQASGIAVIVQRSRARAVLKGTGSKSCTLEFVTRDEDVKVGDTVITSGFGGLFPKGLPVGEVTMVKRGEYGIFQTITIHPFANIEHLEEVTVVLREPNE